MKKRSEDMNHGDNNTDELKKECNATPESPKKEEVASDIPKAEEQDEVERLKADLEAQNDKYVRLAAEFDNFRRRTMKEKADLIQNGGERVLTELLPVVDDMELALKNIREASDVAALREGVELICNKFFEYLHRHGVEEIETLDKPFDDERQQAIAMVPAPDEDKKGMVLDCTKKGYTLNGKVIRFADVVVGE